MKVAIIGSGNVADVMAGAIAASGLELVQLFARNRGRGSLIAARCGCAFASMADELARADLYIISVSDRAVAEVAAGLDFGDAVVAHTAGSVGLEAFGCGVQHGAVLYPVQTFSKGREVDLRSVPFLVEYTDEKAEMVISGFASAMSLKTHFMTGSWRAEVHLAAVIACNFTNHFYALAERFMAGRGLSFDLLRPLIAECASKALAASSPADVQSGPALRGDSETLLRHERMLVDDPRLLELYRAVSRSIREMQHGQTE